MKFFKRLALVIGLILALLPWQVSLAQSISGPTFVCWSSTDTGPLRYDISSGCTASWEAEGAEVVSQTSTSVYIRPQSTYFNVIAYHTCPGMGLGSTTLTVETRAPVNSSVTLSGPSSVSYGTSATFTASATVTGGGGSTLAFSINGSLKQSGTSTTFTTTQLLNGDVVSVQCTPTGVCAVPSFAQSTVTVTNMPIVSPPQMPLISANSCGSRTVTRREDATSTMAYYWQGSPTGQSQSTLSAEKTRQFTVSSTGYIRAKDLTTGVWSVATEFRVEVDPVDVVLTSYTTSVAVATNSITFGPGFTVSNGQQFEAEVGPTKECNDIYNWTEELGYGEDGQVIASSRMYFNGLGNVLQSQVKMFSTSNVLVSQPLYDASWKPVASTLVAPIVESMYVYKPKFVTNSAGQVYDASDFDKVGTTDRINNPNPVGNGTVGTLGWYYSANNTWEPLTPMTSFPYSRSYSPEGPGPLVSTSAGAGDWHRMGSGHEVKAERQRASTSDLQHYLSLRTYFVPESVAPVVGYKYLTTDANGRQSVLFQDVEGRTLASAIVLGAEYANWSYTYYNDGGQKVASVAPNGVQIGNTAYPEFVTLYKYDHLTRLIEIESADEGIIRYVYSSDGKLRFSENPDQRASHRFSYTNYDKLGRTIEMGEYAGGGSGEVYVFEPATTATPSANSVLKLVDLIGFTGVSRKVAAQQSRCLDYVYIDYDKPVADFPGGTTETQENLFNQISRAENANIITWSSYDEFGDLVKRWQKVVGMGANVIKTVSYRYDYIGNIVEIRYQEGDAEEDFYHYYEYDEDQRLRRVYTSTDDVHKSLKATYYYYLNGGLKRVELADGLQGIDYVYNINGSVKFINHADPQNDPGKDSFEGENARFQADIFGEVIDYHENDYTAAGYSAESFSASAYSDQYNGNIKAVRWHSSVDGHIPRAYAFNYDDRYQMKDADWGNVVGTSGNYSFLKSPSSAHRESVNGYDKNGNISRLNRKDAYGSDLSNFRYVYTPGSNRLKEIKDHGTDGVLKSYQYDLLGRTTEQVDEDKTFRFKYNSLGLVESIRNAENKILTTYSYDGFGNRVEKTTYDVDGTGNDPILRTFFIYAGTDELMAVYEQIPGESARLVELPVVGASRLGVYKPEVTTTFFEVSDHLGNVRGVIGNPDIMVYTATMEDNGQATISNPRVQELAVFENLSETVVEDGRMNKTAASTQVPVPNKSSYLRWVDGVEGNDADHKSVGPALALEVEAGDEVDIQTWAKYKKKSSYSRNDIVSAMAGILGNAYVGTMDGIDVLSNAVQTFQNGLNPLVTITGGGTTPDRPFAYVYYMLYSRSFQPITQGYSRIPTTAGFDPGSESLSQHQLMSIPTVHVEAPGYLYVFVTNESEDTDVWFDDLRISHKRSPVVAGGDYYPFGLAMEDRQATREPYRYGFQGQFSEKDLTTGMQEFDLRMYDPEIGRWITPDPLGQYASPYVGMGNAPHMGVDPTGGATIPTTVFPAFTVIGSGYALIAKGVAAGMVNSMASFSVTSGGCPNPPCDDRRQFSNENQLLGSAGQYDTPLSNVAQEFPELPQAAAMSTMAYNPIDKYLAGSNPARLRAIEPSFIAKARTWGVGEEIIYNVANNGYLAVRTVFLKPFLGNDIRNLDGTLSTARERQMAFAMTAALMVSSVSSAASSQGVNRIYSSRELLRRAAEPGPFHNFPEYLNEAIFSGSRTVTPNFFRVAKPGLSNTNILYQMPGTLNGARGVFEIGVRPSLSGNTELIMHRFFRPY